MSERAIFVLCVAAKRWSKAEVKHGSHEATGNPLNRLDGRLPGHREARSITKGKTSSAGDGVWLGLKHFLPPTRSSRSRSYDDELSAQTRLFVRKKWFVPIVHPHSFSICCSPSDGRVCCNFKRIAISRGRGYALGDAARFPVAWKAGRQDG